MFNCNCPFSVRLTDAATNSHSGRYLATTTNFSGHLCLKRLAKAARNGAIPGGTIEDGILHVDHLKQNVPPEADELVLDLYRRLPDARITDILLDVEKGVGFSEAFTHLRTGVPCADKIGLLNVLLAEGLNLGPSKMADMVALLSLHPAHPRSAFETPLCL